MQAERGGNRATNQNLVYTLFGQFFTVTQLLRSMRNGMKGNMADLSIGQSTSQTCHAKFQLKVNDVLQNFAHIVSLREEQVHSLENLVARSL